ncbi:MAG: TetR/AcrR family transcriptional regulator [Thermoplasmata archaeon]|nr:MAG: TetR/AcrR family transcriptional regulator [Thermoplasmata archaeon]
MTRKVKDPEVRRKELVNIAEKLFIKKGYEETPVSAIVKKAKVAQGTFYYYFDSKDDVLDAIVDKLLIEVTKNLEDIVSRNDLDAIPKMVTMSGYFRTLGKGRGKLFEYLHEERNAHLHLKIEKRIYPVVIPLYTKIIKQGIKEGVFHTKFPQEAAISVIAISNALSEGKHDHAGGTEIDSKRIKAIIHMSERILGARHGTFNRYISKMEVKK